MNILFSDPYLVVAEKSAGVLSQGDEKNENNMPSLLAKEISGPIFPVHRLDRETGGVMVFARTKAAAAALSSAIAQRDFEKQYWAVIGMPVEKTGEMHDLLFFDRSKGKVFPVKKMRKGVKDAHLRYEVEKEAEGLSLVRIFPLTGRTHQIRVQFATRGAPLYGDRKYGGKGEGLALFCASLSFPHPKSGKTLSFSLPLPQGEPWDRFSPHK